MEITEFPQELQFEFLLDLPYQEIIRYCQTNRDALKICQSELFWNLKLKRTEYLTGRWGYPKPKDISIIRGPTPATKYRILEEILNSGSEPAWNALGEGQIKLFRFFKEDKPELFDPTTIIASSAVYNAALNKHYDAVELAWSELDPDFRENIFQDAISDALDYGDNATAIYLSKFLGSPPLELLDISLEQYYSPYNSDRHETLEKIVTLVEEIRRSVDRDILQKFILHLFTSNDQPGVIIEALAAKFPGEVDISSLIRETLNKNPYTSWMSKYVI